MAGFGLGLYTYLTLTGMNGKPLSYIVDCPTAERSPALQLG